MIRNACLFFLAIFFLASCTPKLTPLATKSYPPLSPEAPVEIYAEADSIESEFDVLRVIKVNKLKYRTYEDSLVTTYHLKKKARALGGNAIKTTKPRKGVVTATIMHIPELRALQAESEAVLESNYRNDNGLPPEGEPEKEMLAPFVFSGNIGYGFRTAKLADGLYGTDREIAKDTRSGLAWDASAKYYFNDTFGIGGMFSLLTGSSDVLAPAKTTSSILFAGPAFLIRGQLPRNDKWILNCSLGIGYIGYYLGSKYGGNYAKITGASVGFLTDLGIEHKFDENLGVAFNITSVSGVLSEYTRNTNGYKEDVKFSSNSYEGLQNLRFSIGLRYYIK